MHNFETIATLLIPIVIVCVALVLAAWASPHLQAFVRLAFAQVASGLQYLSGGLGSSAVVLAGGVGTLRSDLTQGGTASLAKVIVAVLVLAPIVVVLVTVDLMLWSQYFSSQSGGLLELPLVGEVPAGTLRALLPVAAAILTGYLVEAQLGLIPMPLARADIEDKVRRRTRAALWVVALVLWSVLVANAVDMATAVHTELGRNQCARLALNELPADAGTDVGFDAYATDPTTSPAGSSVASGSGNAAAVQAACMSEWQADSVGRSMQIVQAELALNLTGLFAWIVFAAASVAGLLVLVLALGVVHTVRFVLGLAARAMVAIGELVVSVLQLPRSLVELVVGAMRRRDSAVRVTEDSLRRNVGQLLALRRLRHRRHVNRATMLSIDGAASRAGPPPSSGGTRRPTSS